MKLYVYRQNPHRGDQSDTILKKVKAIVKYSISVFLHLIPHRVFVRALDNISMRENHNTTSRVGNYSYFNPTNIFKDIQPYDIGVFEGLTVFLPKNWDYHLSHRYGDYMSLPPEKDRLGHEPYVLDFGDY